MATVALPPRSLSVVFELFLSKMRTCNGQTEEFSDLPDEFPMDLSNWIDSIGDLLRAQLEVAGEDNRYTRSQLIVGRQTSKQLMQAQEEIETSLAESAKPLADFLRNLIVTPEVNCKPEPESGYNKKSYTNLLPSIHRSHKRKRKGKQKK